MITGVTSGDMRNPITNRRAGICGLDSPSAARVPSTVASAVAAVPMMMLFARALLQDSSVTTSRYQRIDQASGSNRSMPSVNVKYGSALKLSGRITRIGAIRKTSTPAQ